MKRPFLLAASLFLAALSLAHGAAAVGPAGADKKQAARQAAADKVFDLAKLHVIDIVISDEGVRRLTDRSETRYRCTFTFDGVVLKDVGIRQAGGEFQPYRAIGGKPTLSIKFNEFVKGQDLHGLEKLVLKNQAQDHSLVNEHLTYEIFRRAGHPAPLTAYAVVTLNGIPSGIYLMREPVNEEFLVRNFGTGNDDGNLYELNFFGGDPMSNPKGIPLKDEVEDRRKRDDLIELAAIATTVPDDFFVQTVAPVLDVDRTLTFLAVEAATSHGDAFSYRNNNTYLYRIPATGRFVLIPHGADQSFGATSPMFALSSPYQPTRAVLTNRFRSVPALLEKYKAEVTRVSQPPVWDEAVLLARVEQIARLLGTAERVGRTASEIARFEASRPVIEAFIRRHGTTWTGSAL